MYQGSTIRQKIGACPLCSGEKKQPLIKGLCNNHYWLQNRMRSAQKLSTKEVIHEDGLPELIEEADIIFSRYVRMATADEKGMIKCFICGKETHYKRAQAMHFIPRGNMFLRYDLRNVKAGDEDCNCYKGGNLVLFAQKLNEDKPGIVDILMEESRTIYKYTRDELRGIINDYSLKVKNIQS